MGAFLLNWLLMLVMTALWSPGALIEAVITSYNTSAGLVQGKLNVHLVPHTHDDVGWLKTVDQYYTGSNNSIQNAAVHLILDSIVTALQEDPNRKFIYVEQAFFQRWWREQTPRKQKIVKKLVKRGQLEFINGGWCMHDEATTHYIDMIDQTTLGHRYIKDQFSKTPRIGWQIDPFGHSAVQGYLLSAELGFDALFFARIDYQEKIKRDDESTLEMVWQGSRTLDSSAQIFTGVLYDHYGPPSGFDFDMDSIDTPIQDDPLLFDFNVKERVDDFVTYAQTQALHFRTNHIMWTMGSDFQYQNAHGWFKQMDKFVNWVNQDGRVNVLYSTPSLYTDALFAANESWPLKEDDFFPYADCPHCYWTGYFTSRPALKGYVRKLSNYLMMARQLEFFVGRRSDGPNTDSLEESMAIAQHHDAVSGTEKQHTANDYAKRLGIASVEAGKVVAFSIGCLVEKATRGSCQHPRSISQCPLLNVSYCPTSESISTTNESLVIITYNALGWNRTDYIRFPVNSKNVQVTDSAGASVPSQVIPISDKEKELRSKYVQAYLGIAPGSAPAYWLVFPATVPGLGYNTYFVSASSNQGQATSSTFKALTKQAAVTVGPGSLRLTFKGNGLLSALAETNSGTTVQMQESYLYYEGHTGVDGNGADGAYLFRPALQSPVPLNSSVNTSVLIGPLVHEVWQEFSPWIYQITRLYQDKDYAELEFVIGPVPVDDNVGKDVIVRFATNIASNSTFYTDSNGRDFIKRVRNYRADWSLEVNEPVAGNYYPLNLGMYIKDAESEISLLVDRATGGSSIETGQLEVMVHRRLLYDDGRGVGEALDEKVCLWTADCEGLTVQGKLYIHVSAANNASRWRRTMGQQVYSPLHLSFATTTPGEDWIHAHVPSFSAMNGDYNMPKNVALITLQELNDGQTLIRLAHLYELNEDKDLSDVAYVDLKEVFSHQQIQDIVEMNLSANQKKAQMKARPKWIVKGKKEGQQAGKRGGPVDKELLIVELGPMEIRTFLLTFK